MHHYTQDDIQLNGILSPPLSLTPAKVDALFQTDRFEEHMSSQFILSRFVWMPQRYFSTQLGCVFSLYWILEVLCLSLLKSMVDIICIMS